MYDNLKAGADESCPSECYRVCVAAECSIIDFFRDEVIPFIYFTYPTRIHDHRPLFTAAWLAVDR